MPAAITALTRTNLELFQHESKKVTFAALGVDLSGKALRFVAFDSLDPPVAKFEVENAGFDHAGDVTGIVAVTIDETKTATAAIDYQYEIWNVDDKTVLIRGKLKIISGVFNV